MSLLDPLLDAVAVGGAAVLGLAMLVENLFPPIPSEAVLPLAGFAVQAGRLNLLTALAAATAGSVAGACALYAVGRFGGRPLLYRYRWLLRLDAAALDRADTWFDRHGTPLVFWARMVPLARSVVSVPAGLSEMPPARFVVLTAAGSLVWNALLIGGGMALGSGWERATVLVGVYGRVALAAMVVAAAVLLAARLRRRQSRR